MITYQEFLEQRLEAAKSVAREFEDRGDDTKAAYHWGQALAYQAAIDEFKRRYPGGPA